MANPGVSLQIIIIAAIISFGKLLARNIGRNLQVKQDILHVFFQRFNKYSENEDRFTQKTFWFSKEFSVEYDWETGHYKQ